MRLRAGTINVSMLRILGKVKHDQTILFTQNPQPTYIFLNYSAYSLQKR